MSNRAILPVLCLASLLGLSSPSYAFMKAQDTANEIQQQSHSGQIQETTAIAEKIWDRLTTEFVNHYENGDYARAAATAQSAFQLAESTFGANHINTADSLLKLGIVAETLGDMTNAKRQMRNALTILENQLGPNHEDVAVVLTNLANVYFEENNAELSEQYHTRALNIRKDTLGEGDPAVAQSMYNLAVLYDDTLQYDRAIQNYEQSIRIWNKTLGAAHPYVANALNNLANVYLATEKYNIAEELHKHSLSIRKVIYGDVHAEVARSLINLGALYVKQNAYEKAKPVYREAVSTAEKLFGPAHPQVAMLLYSLANIYHIQGRMDRNSEEKLAVRQMQYPEHTRSATLRTNTQATSADSVTLEMTSLHESSQAYFSQALPLYERALEILDGTIGSGHPAMTAMMTELALLYKSIGKTTKAAQLQVRLNKTE